MRNYFIGLLAVLALTACEERYRYACQNPDNFSKPDCQRPKCMFTQNCPDYLVAPVLEKQIGQQPAPAQPASDSR